MTGETSLGTGELSPHLSPVFEIDAILSLVTIYFPALHPGWVRWLLLHHTSIESGGIRLAVGISLLELIYTLVTDFMYLTMLTLLILRYSDIPAFPWYLTVLTL